MTKNNDLVSRYYAAFEAANGHKAALVTYYKGWYTVKGITYHKCRAKQLEAMTERLLSRAKKRLEAEVKS